ncbi:hypothetical protein DOY81_000491 [Sarcophaga bullata]|nr:hypothetical protein DOY81_000491 [Sarcophaga bullata]
MQQQQQQNPICPPLVKKKILIKKKHKRMSKPNRMHACSCYLKERGYDL